jgi:hypothetical protein
MEVIKSKDPTTNKAIGTMGRKPSPMRVIPSNNGMGAASNAGMGVSGIKK